MQQKMNAIFVQLCGCISTKYAFLLENFNIFFSLIGSRVSDCLFYDDIRTV